jgi:hypothetical protein
MVPLAGEDLVEAGEGVIGTEAEVEAHLQASASGISFTHEAVHETVGATVTLTGAALHLAIQIALVDTTGVITTVAESAKSGVGTRESTTSGKEIHRLPGQ